PDERAFGDLLRPLHAAGAAGIPHARRGRLLDDRGPCAALQADRLRRARRAADDGRPPHRADPPDTARAARARAAHDSGARAGRGCGAVRLARFPAPGCVPRLLPLRAAAEPRRPLPQPPDPEARARERRCVRAGGRLPPQRRAAAARPVGLLGGAAGRPAEGGEGVPADSGRGALRAVPALPLPPRPPPALAPPPRPPRPAPPPAPLPPPPLHSP